MTSAASWDPAYGSIEDQPARRRYYLSMRFTIAPDATDRRLLRAVLQAPDPGMLREVALRARRCVREARRRASTLWMAGYLCAFDGEPWALTLLGMREIGRVRERTADGSTGNVSRT